MGRRKIYIDGRVNVPVRMPSDLRDRLAAAAAERDLSANWLACRAIEEFLDRLIPVDQLTWTRREGTPGEKLQTSAPAAAVHDTGDGGQTPDPDTSPGSGVDQPQTEAGTLDEGQVTP